MDFSSDVSPGQLVCVLSNSCDRTSAVALWGSHPCGFSRVSSSARKFLQINRSSPVLLDLRRVTLAELSSIYHRSVFVSRCYLRGLGQSFDKGKIICNPPYGIRLEDQGDTHKLYVKMGHRFREHFKSWHYYILSGDESFEDYFNKKATKKRKLFNGKIRCDLYQYF